MTPKEHSATIAQMKADCARTALIHLRKAYHLLKHAPRTRERVRLAITSAGGAVRHAEARRWR